MQFEREHEFTAPVARVATLMSDPDFQTQLDLPDLSRPVVVDYEVDGSSRLLRLRYQYIGQLDSIARRVVGDRTLTWIQALQIDSTAGTGTLTFSAEEDAGRVNGSATVAIVPTDAGCSRRRIAGDFRIHIPLVGGTAERKIVPGLVRRLDVEADALSASSRPDERSRDPRGRAGGSVPAHHSGRAASCGCAVGRP